MATGTFIEQSTQQGVILRALQGLCTKQQHMIEFDRSIATGKRFFRVFERGNLDKSVFEYEVPERNRAESQGMYAERISQDVVVQWNAAHAVRIACAKSITPPQPVVEKPSDQSVIEALRAANSFMETKSRDNPQPEGRVPSEVGVGQELVEARPVKGRGRKAS